MDIQGKSLDKSYGLMRAAEAVTDWKALALTCAAGVVSFLFVAITAWLAKSSVALGGVFMLVTFVVWLIGYSSVGILLMRRAQGQAVSMMDAVMQATFTVHRLLGVAVLLFLLFLGVALAALLVLLVCKIPGIGPVLYGLAFPILTIILGVTVAAMFYVGFPLAAPAIWEGNTAVQTIARLIGIVRTRLLSVITNLVILALLVMFISCVVFFLLAAGYSTTTGLSTTVGISPVGGIGSMLPMGGLLGGVGQFAGGGYGGYGLGETNSYAGSFAFASGLLFTIGAIIPFLTYIIGTCLVYLLAAQGLNFSATEAKLREGVEEAKRRTQEARERAHARMNEAKTAMEPAPQTTFSPATAAPAPQRSCSSCHTSLALDDLFCGDCGTKNPN
jgi:hypothetical protein